MKVGETWKWGKMGMNKGTEHVEALVKSTPICHTGLRKRTIWKSPRRQIKRKQ